PSLRIPWHPSLGNHDYRGNVDCEIEYSKLNARWKFPSRYYAQKENIDDSNYLLIVHLDTTPFIKNYQREADIYHVENQDINRQLYWLDSVLTFSGARWTIVVGHHSIYAAASNHGNTQELTDKILPILTKHHVPLYVCGHYHVAQRLIRGATNFVVCGGGSSAGSVDQREDVVFGAGSLGFLSVSVSSENIRLKIINEKSDILYAFQISDN
ncbi:MAG: metallophosphoesterase, partial [Melioribacteraceae bacterium]